MKKFTIVLCALSSIILVPTVAEAKRPLRSHEQSLVKLCEAIKDDQRHVLRKRMRSLKVDTRTLVAKLKCNNVDPITFAMRMGSQETADYLSKKAGLAFLAKNAKVENQVDVTQ